MPLKKMGEFELIGRLTRKIPKKNARLRLGIGDDCAVISWPKKKDLLITTDMLIEGQHFQKNWISMRQLGRRAALVNLSDIAAMGGTPLYMVVAVGLPNWMNLQKSKEFFQGIQEIARKGKTQLIGGDTNRSQKLTISITVLGEVEKGRSLKRSGARAGDFIYVTGMLGEAVKWLKRKKLREPPLRTTVGRSLVQKRIVHACIDVSDGFLADLSHLLEESRVGAEVWVDQLPGTASRILRLTGGEDFELLFTSRSQGFSKVCGIPVRCVGKIVRQKGICLFDHQGKRLALPRKLGFTHF